jgi:centriolar protein POC1
MHRLLAGWSWHHNVQLPGLAGLTCCSTMLQSHGVHGLTYHMRVPALPQGADEQIMVWKTNFDRQLEDYVLTSASKADVPSAKGNQADTLRSSATFKQPPLGSTSRPATAAGALSPGSTSNRPPTAGTKALPATATTATNSTAGRIRSTQRAQQPQREPLIGPAPTQQPQQQPQQQQEPWSATEAPPGNYAGLPDIIASQLQHLTNTVDMMAQTVAMLDLRMAASEDRLERLNDKVLMVLGQQAGQQQQGVAGVQQPSV